MPLATPVQYAETLDAAKAGAYAVPAVSVTSSMTLNAAIQWFVSVVARHKLGSEGVRLARYEPRARRP
jgi:hypothetical protein